MKKRFNYLMHIFNMGILLYMVIYYIIIFCMRFCSLFVIPPFSSKKTLSPIFQFSNALSLSLSLSVCVCVCVHRCLSHSLAPLAAAVSCGGIDSWRRQMKVKISTSKSNADTCCAKVTVRIAPNYVPSMAERAI